MSKVSNSNLTINVHKLIEEYFWVIPKGEPAKLFKFREEQEILYRDMAKSLNKGEGFRAIILKARQLGFTTEIAYIFFAICLTQENKNLMIVSHRQDTSQEIYGRIKYALSRLPEELKPVISKANEELIEFDSLHGKRLNNRIWIKVPNPNTDSLGRGFSLDGLHLSEYPQWQGNKRATLNSLLDSAADNALIFIESTARGYDDFRDRYYDALNNPDSGFKAYFFPWYSNKKYTKEYWGFELNKEEEQLKEKHNLSNEQLAWRRWKIASYKNDVNFFRQEYPSTADEAFISSGECIFDMNKIHDRIFDISTSSDNVIDKGYYIYDLTFDNITQERKLTNIKWISDRKNGFISIYIKKEKRVPYVMAIDPSGDGSDYSACNVINNMNCKQVAIFHKEKMKSLDISAQAYCLGIEYNNALLTAETNYAPEVITYLKEFGYSNLYMMQQDDTNANVKFLNKYGFRTSQITRPKIIDRLKTYINENTECINSIELLNEAQNFIRTEKEVNGKKVFKEQANTGKHDDLLMSMAITLYIRESGQQSFTLLPEEEVDNNRGYTEADWIFGNVKIENRKDFMTYD